MRRAPKENDGVGIARDQLTSIPEDVDQACRSPGTDAPKDGCGHCAAPAAGANGLAGRRRNEDRRLRPRFEVVGDLWGTLDIPEPLPVVNIGASGALIEADRPWAVGAIHSIVMANGTEVGRARICVKHVRQLKSTVPRFLIGVEFLSISPALAEQVTRWVASEGHGVLES